jgi:hypothetical protein
MRIHDREDFAFTFGEFRSSSSRDFVSAMEDKLKRSKEWLWRKGYGDCLWSYDSYIPGPAYFIDGNVYYGIFLPHTDNVLGPMHRADAESAIAEALRHELEMLKTSAESAIRPPQPGRELGTALGRRLEQLELAVAWLQHPANSSDAPMFEKLQNAVVVEDWTVSQLANAVSEAEYRVWLYQEWAEDPGALVPPGCFSRKTDNRVVCLSPDGEFIKLRSSLLCGGRKEGIPDALARARRFAKTAATTIRDNYHGVEARANGNTFMPVNVCIIDDRVFYSLALTSGDPWHGAAHLVEESSAPGQAIVGAYRLLWKSASPLNSVIL